MKYSDDEIKMVLQRRFINGDSYDSISKAMPHGNKMRVKRILDYARENDLFRVEFTNSTRPLIKPNFLLAKKLEDKFPHLKRAYVLDSIQHAKRLFDADKDDLTHKALGRFYAKNLKDTIKALNLRKIAIGGGRGPYYFSQAMLKDKPGCDNILNESCKIYSLSGQISTTFWGKNDKYLTTDADDAAQVLSRGLKIKLSNLHQVNHPLVYGSYTQGQFGKQRVLDTRFGFLDDNFWQYTSSLAVIGLGVLAGGHRFTAVNSKESSFPNYELSSIAEDLRSLFEFFDLEANEYPPVMDLCNFLIPVPAVFHELVRKRRLPKLDAFNRWNHLVKCIGDINKKLITVSPSELTKFSDVVVVAGGKFKGKAIHYGLHKKLFNQIVTDQDIAIRLLADERKKPIAQSITDFYKEYEALGKLERPSLERK